MPIGIYQTKKGSYLFLNGEGDAHGFFAQNYKGEREHIKNAELFELRPIYTTELQKISNSNLRAQIQEKKKEANFLEDKLNEVEALSQSKCTGQ